MRLFFSPHRSSASLCGGGSSRRFRGVGLVFAAAAALALGACAPKGEASSAAAAPSPTGASSQEAPGSGAVAYEAVPAIAVFVPGITAGSPVYEMLVAGAKRAAQEAGATFKVVEGGYNQADWPRRLAELAAEERYGLIVTSNPAMPDICASVSQGFPKQRFLVLDGYLPGNPMIRTLRYNQREEGYLAGYIAGLMSTGGNGKSAARKVALLAGQEYPAMNGTILPAYLEGARAALDDPEIQADFRVVGNWYDAAKGAELSASMIRDGSRVILAVAGGANAGAIQAAVEAGAYVVWFDVSGYEQKPGTVVGSATIDQDRAAYEGVAEYLAGTLPFGSADTLGVSKGFVGFDQDNPIYVSSVPEAARKRMAALVEDLRSGRLSLPLAD